MLHAARGVGPKDDCARRMPYKQVARIAARMFEVSDTRRRLHTVALRLLVLPQVLLLPKSVELSLREPHRVARKVPSHFRFLRCDGDCWGPYSKSIY
jgi:hypothetical protein